VDSVVQQSGVHAVPSRAPSAKRDATALTVRDSRTST
jgi:hypothetical protein